MSEARHITFASTSNAQDAAWLAVADVAAVATDLGIDYRVIGGNSVGAADELLVQVARRLLDCVRGCETLTRHGGEEFVILL